MNRKPRFVWMEISKDRYELPIYVADSAKELAELTGKQNATAIISAVSHAKKRGGWCKYTRVPITEETQEGEQNDCSK